MSGVLLALMFATYMTFYFDKREPTVPKAERDKLESNYRRSEDALAKAWDDTHKYIQDIMDA